MTERDVDPAIPKRLTDQEFAAILDQLALHSNKIPDLPNQAYSRAGIYQDPA